MNAILAVLPVFTYQLNSRPKFCHRDGCDFKLLGRQSVQPSHQGYADGLPHESGYMTLCIKPNSLLAPQEVTVPMEHVPQDVQISKVALNFRSSAQLASGVLNWSQHAVIKRVAWIYHSS